MPLTIKTTGIEDYVSGDGRIKMLVVGGAGVGKTRMSSFWPRPIYADCEGGRGSLADRNVPYAEIKNSQDMLDFLAHLKTFESKPRDQRPYDTVVIDTIDAFQRKVIDERLDMTKKQAFDNYQDWGYLDTKIQMLLTRLLNLDLNVLVLVHYKDKIVGKGDDARTEVQFQLKGDVKDSILNDFDLVGRLGAYWVAEEGERVEKRGLTFKKTPDWPQLKDRYGVLPPYTPISLTSETDYTFIRDAFHAQLDSLKAGEVVGEIPTAGPELPGAGVVDPTGGPLPPQDPRDVPLHQFDKPTLVKMCREATPPITTTIDGTPIKGNSVKAELVQALELRREQDKAAEATKPAESDASPASPEAPAAAESTPAAVESADFTLADIAVPTLAEVKASIPTQVTPDAAPDAAPTAVEEASPQAEAPAEPESVPETVVESTPEPEPQTVATPVDVNTGEIAPADPSSDVVDAAVVEVPSEPASAEISSVAETALAGAPADGPTCEEEGCVVPLSTQKSDYVTLSRIRFKRALCNAHYIEARKAG